MRDVAFWINTPRNLVGTYPWFTPPFVRPKLDAFASRREAIRAWANEVIGVTSQAT